MQRGHGMADPEVSIVMPVCNSRPDELREAVESVLGQTLHAVELVCVDDGSTDDTFARLEAFARQDDRVRLIRFPANKGTLAARNAAILAAKGRYVLPLDPDDALHPEACEKLSAIMGAHALDMLQFAVETSEAGGRYRMLTNPTSDDVLAASEFARDVFLAKKRSWAVIVKMFRREPLASAAAAFPEGYCANGEDGLLLFAFLAAVQRVGCTPLTLYRYRYGHGISTSARASRAQTERIMRSLRYSLPWTKAQDRPLGDALRRELLATSLGTLAFARIDGASRLDAMRALAPFADAAEIMAACRSFMPGCGGRFRRWTLLLKRAFARRGARHRKLSRKLALCARAARMAAAARAGKEGTST